MRISWPIVLLALILVASFATMATVSLQESAIMDELAHIPAGYGYVKFLDYRLNPEHPPLVKIVSAIPLTFFNLNFPTDRTAWQDDVNGQWAAGTQFLYESGNNADQIIQWARVGPMILTLILIAFVYFWSRELLGPKWAFLPTIFTAFSPTILAHGHYVTTDIGAALGVIVALYFFVRYLTKHSRRNLIFAGLAFGFAQLLKFSAVLLIPYLLILAAIFWGISNHQNLRGGFGKLTASAWRIFRSVILVFLIGLFLIYPFYFITTLNYPPDRQLRDTDFTLSSFADGPPAPGEICAPMRCVAEFNIWMADKPLLRPMAQYMLGILMVMQRSAGGNTAYFLGEVSASGSPLYFPAVYLMKEPVPILTLIVLTLLYALYRVGRAIKRRQLNFADYSLTRLPELSMLLFIVIYGVYSITSPLNIGVRHLLPIMPLAYILIAAGLKGFAQASNRNLILGFTGLLMLWFLVSVGRAYPHYLSYFNEAIGTDNGWRYVTDSNYDWGQDLKRLKEFVDNPPAGEKVDKIAVDYFGGGSPTYYLGGKAVLWQSAKGNPKESGVRWLAVSVGFLQNAKGELHSGHMRNLEDEYRWLENYQEPYARAGKSIFIYKLD
ncbi:MAG: glycosyltransferase family 39 protein [Candidatus Colwellbacteria bacterium]|nr:glycosyltransferase family 39 protein [Candidatus Colwellbacteria bacterium]